MSEHDVGVCWLNRLRCCTSDRFGEEGGGVCIHAIRLGTYFETKGFILPRWAVPELSRKSSPFSFSMS